MLRYNTSKVDDGLPPGEGVFLACSFWMVSALKAVGRTRDARALFEKLLHLRNDLGLLSEEYDVKSKRMVGNFPQAFSHIALVNAAFYLGARAVRARARIAMHERKAQSQRVGHDPDSCGSSRVADRMKMLRNVRRIHCIFIPPT